MEPIIPWIWAAGVVQVLIACSNFPAARVLDYRGNLARVDPMVREIFWVQNLYIEITLVGLALLCFFFAGDLAGQSSLGRACSGFLTFFWGLRLGLQLFYYNRGARREHPLIDSVFLLAQVYLTGVFAVATLGAGYGQ